MFQWAEVRHLHLVEGAPKKEIARRLKLDVKTVRRAIGRSRRLTSARRHRLIQLGVGEFSMTASGGILNDH